MMYKRMFFIGNFPPEGLKMHITDTMIFRPSNSDVLGIFILESENRSDISIIDAIVELYNDDDAYRAARERSELRRRYGGF